MKNQNKIVNDDYGNAIDVKELIKRYPWTKTIEAFIAKKYQINKSSRFKGDFVDYYAFCKCFGEYLNERVVVMPDVADVTDFLSEVALSLYEMQKCVPIICDFCSYCFDHQGDLFGGAIKDVELNITISRGISLLTYQVNLDDYYGEDNTDA